jgi:aldehyde:ferredoxin oxidoreductase
MGAQHLNEELWLELLFFDRREISHMPNGYHGKILFIDLTSGSYYEESLPDKIYRDYIGSVGLGVRILYEHMKPGIDALGPDNMLGFVPGLLTGAGIHGSRFQVVTKSPVTGGWGDSSSGGSFAHALKATGYDGVFFTGASAKPVYVFLNDGKVEIKDAGKIWGQDTVETENSVREELGDRGVKVVCIGPAGEAKSLMACMRHEGSAAGRSGVGAVMGSKNLKAFAVKGSKKVTLADPEGFAKLRKEYFKSVKESEHPWKLLLSRGTCTFLSPQVLAGDSSINNWQLFGEEHFPNHAQISGDSVLQYQYKKHACTGCPMACKGWLRMETKYGLVECSKVEYETLSVMGPNCSVDDLGAILKCNDLCNRLGLDTIGTGNVIAFAMECYQRGAITKEDTGGIDLTWGNADALIQIIEQIGRRRGFGAVLADGAKLAAERIGKGSEAWAMHVGGQDMPAHDGRVMYAMGWGYVVDPTPGRHTTGQTKSGWERGAETAPPDFIQPELDPFDLDNNATEYARCTGIDRLFDSAGLCIIAHYPETLRITEVMIAVTGWDFTIDEGIKTGLRVQNLRQAFNIREGVDTTKWTLPDRLARPQQSGPNKDKPVIDFKAVKVKGYEAMGWDETGRPKDSTLKELGLDQLVGKLP